MSKKVNLKSVRLSDQVMDYVINFLKVKALTRSLKTLSCSAWNRKNPKNRGLPF